MTGDEIGENQQSVLLLRQDLAILAKAIKDIGEVVHNLVNGVATSGPTAWDASQRAEGVWRETR